MKVRGWKTITALAAAASLALAIGALPSQAIGAVREQCLRPVDRPGWVYLPGDHLESQAMTGVGAPTGKVQPDAHCSSWRQFWP